MEFLLYKNSVPFIPKTGKTELEPSGKLGFEKTGTNNLKMIKQEGVFYGEGISTSITANPEQFSAIEVNFSYKTSDTFEKDLVRLYLLNVDGFEISEISLEKSEEFKPFTFQFSMKNSSNYTLCFHPVGLKFDSYELEIENLTITPKQKDSIQYIFPVGFRRDIEIIYKRSNDPSFPNYSPLNNEAKAKEFWANLMVRYFEEIPFQSSVNSESVRSFALSNLDGITDQTPSGQTPIGYTILLSGLNNTMEYILDSFNNFIVFTSEQVDSLNDVNIPTNNQFEIFDSNRTLFVAESFYNPTGNDDLGIYISVFVNQFFNRLTSNKFLARQNILNGKTIRFPVTNKMNYEVLEDED